MAVCGTGVTWGFAAALALATTVGAWPGGGVVRNTDPERSAAAEPQSMPIYFPLEPRRTPGVAEGELPEDLLRRFMSEHTSMRYGAAVETALRLTDALPDRPLGHYNLACALARLDRIDEALASLDRAVECGWRNATHMEVDPDLRMVRRTTAYARLLERMGTLAEAERGPAGPLRRDPWPDVAEDLSRQIPDLLDRYHVPGAAVALISDGAVVWSAAFGTNDNQTREAMGTDRRFAAAAPVQLCTVLAAIQQDTRGNISLAEIVAAAEEMRQLDRMVVHQPGPISLASLAGDGVAPPNVSNAGRIHSPERSGRPAGADWMLTLLVMSIEATGHRFHDYCQDQILEPVRMDATEFPDGPLPPKDLATGHSLLGSPVQIQSVPDVMYTSVGDVARLLAALMDQDDAAPLADAPFRRLLAFASVAGVGSACRVGQGPDGAYLELAESRGGVGMLARLCVRSGRGIVVMFNSETGPPMAERVGRIALGGESF